MMSTFESTTECSAYNVVFLLTQELRDAGLEYSSPLMIADAISVYDRIRSYDSDFELYVTVAKYAFDVYSNPFDAGRAYERERADDERAMAYKLVGDEDGEIRIIRLH